MPISRRTASRSNKAGVVVGRLGLNPTTPWLPAVTRPCCKLLLIPLLLLIGCQPRDDGAALLDDYGWRMGNVFGFHWQAPAPPLFQPPYPGRRQLQRRVESLSINLLDFLKLSPCDLQRLLGERNSSLGKVMADSQRLAYELAFIELANRCIQQLHEGGDDSGLAQTLRAAVRTKRASLADVHWNATWASAEFQTLFSDADHPVAASYWQSPATELEESLQQLLSGPLSWQPAGGESWQTRRNLREQQLGIVARGNYLGQLRREMAWARLYLQAVEEQVLQRQARRPICLMQRLSDDGRVMQRVMLRSYIGEVQPLLSALDRRLLRLRPVLQASLEQQASLPRPMDDYWRQVWSADAGSEWQAFRTAVVSHTRMWQELLQHCGLQPGRAAGDEG